MHYCCWIEEATLREEVKGELLDISFENNEKKYSIEGIFFYQVCDAIFEENSWQYRKDNVDEDDDWQLEEEVL